MKTSQTGDPRGNLYTGNARRSKKLAGLSH